MPISATHPTFLNLVEGRGIEPLTQPCKGHVFPLAPTPQKILHLKILINATTVNAANTISVVISISLLVPGAGLEPASLSTADFKSAMFAISSPGQICFTPSFRFTTFSVSGNLCSQYLATLQGVEPRLTVLETAVLP